MDRTDSLDSGAQLWQVWRDRRASQGQGGFVIMAGLMVWMTVGGMAMVALLSMTTSATMQATQQATRAQQLRALDAALETAVVEVQIDPSGRVGQPTGKDDGSCESELGASGKGLVYDDGLGNQVTVTSSCSGSTKKNEPHQVRLSAHLDSSKVTVGGATLEVVKAKGPGNDVTVLDWSLAVPPADMVTPTTTPTSTTTTLPATTSTTTPTTTSTTPTGVSWSSRVTSEWQSGYCVDVTVTNNNKNTEKWTVQVPVKGTIYAFWSAKYTRAGNTLTATGESWNQSLKSGESTVFGWCSNF